MAESQIHKRYVRIDNNIKEQSNLICGKFAVGRSHNLTRDNEVEIGLRRLADYGIEAIMMPNYQECKFGHRKESRKV